MPQPHFLYVMSQKRDGKFVAPVKIGITNNPHARLRDLQTACPFQLYLVFCFPVGRRDWAMLAEREIHKAYAASNLLGEWFDVAPIDAVYGSSSVVGLVCGHRLPPERFRVRCAEVGVDAALEFCITQEPSAFGEPA